MSGDDPSNSGHVGGRYRLLAHLGTGTAGAVYRAEDVVTGGVVAVKVLTDPSPRRLARLDREARVLREVGIPGVVRLLGEGTHAGTPFLVMEFVDGAPFPGPVGGGWAEIAPTVVRLFAILARVHEAGVLHRDLKPGNVLVDAAGAPTVLDFGLARFASATSALTLTGDVLGTPRYQAPEQVLCDRPVDSRADLYAVGVMLYEALAGRSPQPARSLGGIYSARLVRDPPPLATLAPHVPLRVARIVDRLVARLPEDRPGSARAVLDDLAGAAPARPAGHLPWLGERAPVVRAVEAVRRGAPVTVSGPRGAGRTRLLDEVAAELATAGIPTVHVRGGERPFESLIAALADGVPPEGDVPVAVEAALRACLAAGRVLLVDDADAVDDWSAALLDDAGGPVIRCVSNASAEATQSEGAEGAIPNSSASVALVPLGAPALAALFPHTGGPPPFVATVLHARTAGLPARVAAEVGAWVAAGHARWAGDRLVVADEVAELLALGPPADPRLGRRAGLPRAEDPLAITLGWVLLAEPEATVPLLAAARGRRAWEIEAEVRALQEHGAAIVGPDGRVWAREDLASGEPATDEARLDAHAAIGRARAPGARGRLGNLLAAELWAEAAAEAELVATAAVRDGFLGMAFAAARWGLRAAAEAPIDATALVGLATRAAIGLGTPGVLERALADVPGRAETELLRAVLHDTRGGGDAGPPPPPLADAALETLREDLLLWRALARDPVAATARVGDLTPTRPERRVLWEARLRAALGRPDEAVALFARALRALGEGPATWPARLDHAHALLEAGLTTDAARAGEQVEAAARRCRLPALAAHAAWIRRAAAYRAGEPGTADPGFVAEVQALGIGWLTARVCLTEAALAWRASSYDEAARLARLAVTARPGADGVATLARALELASADNIVESTALGLVVTADALPDPAIGLQVRGLVALAMPAHAAALLPGALTLGARAGRLGEIRGVLSGGEAIAFCRAAARRRRGPPDRPG